MNAVIPGPVATDSLATYLGDQPHLLDLLLRHTPTGALATPEDIAAVATFLCSDMAQAVTGQSLAVDGGISAQGGPWYELTSLTKDIG